MIFSRRVGIPKTTQRIKWWEDIFCFAEWRHGAEARHRPGVRTPADNCALYSPKLHTNILPIAKSNVTEKTGHGDDQQPDI